MSETFTMRLLDLLSTTAGTLVDRLAADACAVSRVVGDMLILVAECAPEGSTLQLGHGYLVPDYPQTQGVLSTRTPYRLTLDDSDVDPSEAEVMRELGFAALLMLPFDVGSIPWGLVEIYRSAPRPFTDDDIALATAILAETAAKAG